MTKDDVDFVRLRVLISYDSEYQAYVAQCLETGSVVTADDSEMVIEMMRELLEDEVTYAVEHENFENLFSTPAPNKAWVKWYKSAKKGEVKTEVLTINAKDLHLDEQEVEARVETTSAA